MPHSGKYHGHAIFICGRDNFFVTHRPAGLDYRADTDTVSRIDTIAKREECIRCHDRTGHFEVGMLCLDRCDTGAVNTRHLSGTNTDCPVVSRINYGIGFDKLGYLPGKYHILHLLVIGFGLAHHFQTLVECLVGVLHQYTAVDMFIVKAVYRRIPLPTAEQAHVFLVCDHLDRIVIYCRRNNNFDELLFDNCLRGARVERAVKGYDAAERGFRISAESILVCIVDIIRRRDTAGIGMFDDNAARCFELLDALECRIGIGNVVK